MLGVVHEGVAYPLLWEMLEKKGNSNSNEPMDLLARFREVFPDTEVAYICGDREFVGKQWLTYLLIEPTIPFRIRIRESDQRARWSKKACCFNRFCSPSTWSTRNFVRLSLGKGVD